MKLFIIYKIVCKTDDALVYVGSTCEYKRRIYMHKYYANNIIGDHDFKVYKAIRENGGWDNWEHSIVEHFECETRSEAIQKEFEYIKSLNATLNETILLSPEEKKASVLASARKTKMKHKDTIKIKRQAKMETAEEQARVKAYNQDYFSRDDVKERKNKRRRDATAAKNALAVPVPE